MKKYSIVCVASVLMLGISGCTDRVSIAEQEMQKIRNQPATPIDPPPVFEPVENFNYDASSLRSPFVPPSLEQILDDLQNQEFTVQPDPNRSKEELESYELSALTLKGVMTKPNEELFALIEKPDGTVFPVTLGNYIGQNHGRITDIAPTAVTLIEIVPDSQLGYVEKTNTLQLPVS